MGPNYGVVGAGKKQWLAASLLGTAEPGRPRITVPPASLLRSIDSHEGMGTKVAHVWVPSGHHGGTCLLSKEDQGDASVGTNVAEVWEPMLHNCGRPGGAFLGRI